MSTAKAATFSDMLNQYLPNPLLKEEFVQRDYVLSNIEKDDGWKTGELIIPFQAAGASSVKFGGLTDTSDISSSKYVRGKISSAVELWGSLIFYHRDLMEHDQVSEQNFLSLLPGQIDDFLRYMKNATSVALLSGGGFSKASAASNSASGVVYVTHVDRFQVNQAVYYASSDASTHTYFVKSINVNTRSIVLKTTLAGSTAVDLSVGGKDILIDTVLYHPGAASTSFQSIRDALLSNANGGSATLHGVTKTDYPYMQAINVSGAAVTAVNIMEKIFDALTEIRQFGRGMPTDIVMSYSRFADCLKVIEGSKGAFNVQPGSQKASQYGWTELSVGSVTKGAVKLVAVQEADDDVILFLDWRALKFYSNGFFRKRKSPDGIEFYEQRDATNGYSYIVDICLFGELAVLRPSYCGIMYSVTY